MFQMAGATAEKALHLDPVNQNTQADRTRSMPPLMAQLAWANTSGVKQSVNLDPCHDHAMTP